MLLYYDSAGPAAWLNKKNKTKKQPRTTYANCHCLYFLLLLCYDTLLVPIITWEMNDSDQKCWQSCQCQKVDHGWLSQLWTPSHWLDANPCQSAAPGHRCHLAAETARCVQSQWEVMSRDMLKMLPNCQVLHLLAVVSGQIYVRQTQHCNATSNYFLLSVIFSLVSCVGQAC